MPQMNERFPERSPARSPERYAGPQTYLPGELIIDEGEAGKEMYFIHEGEVDVVTAAAPPDCRTDGRIEGAPDASVHERKLAAIGAGGHFGEIDVILCQVGAPPWRRHANAPSLTSDLSHCWRPRLRCTAREYLSAYR